MPTAIASGGKGEPGCMATCIFRMKNYIKTFYSLFFRFYFCFFFVKILHVASDMCDKMSKEKHTQNTDTQPKKGASAENLNRNIQMSLALLSRRTWRMRNFCLSLRHVCWLLFNRANSFFIFVLPSVLREQGGCHASACSSRI